MAMFSRRSLQRMLNGLADALPIGAREKFAHELNRQDPSALGYEWELGLVHALNAVGSIRYEASSEVGSRRPDITFAEANHGAIQFTADVATVSDDGLAAENPVTRFSLELGRLKRKYKLSGSTDFRIEGEASGPSYPDRKMRLKLPPAAKLGDFLKQHVEPEFKRIKDQNLAASTLVVKEPGVAFTVKYGTNARYSSGSYPSYTAAYSRKRNPVYTTLKAKVRQLKGSGSENPFGIFLCDGGCNLLSNTQRYVQNFNIGDVIGEFFRQNSSVGFVAVLVFPPTRSGIFTGLIKELRIAGHIYVNPRAAKKIPANALLALVNRGLATLPPPAATPHDALHWIARTKKNRGKRIETIQYSGNIMTESVKISARKVQEMLAGELTPKDVFKEYQRPGSKFENPFQMALKRGLTMESITLIPQPDLDDDLLEITFGLPDPAVSRIKATEKK